ncbi:MAG: hypothetical protein O7J95_06480, partial [Planctomycetota bacterium]|nr:hypothetical protein [Planctomycetota bacterium]
MALALAAGALRAHDLVELQSGEVFYGRVLRHNKSEVSIQLASGGILSFRISQVRRVRQKRHERPKFDLETFLRGAFPNQDEAPADPTVPGTQL